MNLQDPKDDKRDESKQAENGLCHQDGVLALAEAVDLAVRDPGQRLVEAAKNGNDGDEGEHREASNAQEEDTALLVGLRREPSLGLVAVANTHQAVAALLASFDRLEGSVGGLRGETSAVSLVPGHKARLGVEAELTRTIREHERVESLSTAIVRGANSRESIVLSTHISCCIHVVSKTRPLSRMSLGFLTGRAIGNGARGEA